MGQAKTTIELNGKLYDATTGVMVSDGPATSVATAPAAPKPTATPSGQVMDGFFRKPVSARPAAAAPAAPKPAPAEQSKPARSSGSNHKSHHKAESSQTLMRHTVSKPKTAQPPVTAQQIEQHGLPHPNNVAHDRQKRAEQTARSSSISRFSLRQHEPVQSSVEPLDVQPHPEEAEEAAAAATPATPVQAQFQKALATADSHQQVAPDKPKLRHKTAGKLGVSSRVVSFGAAGLAAILLIAFIAYQSIPSVSMQLASSRAGFQATLPSYTASGFGMSGPINTSPGTVTVSFKSNSDSRNYQVSQSPSNWNSQALLNNYVASNNKTYQTVEDKGKTIYIYNGAATWVNGGVWYRVTGNANLSSQQLTSIANSL